MTSRLYMLSRLKSCNTSEIKNCVIKNSSLFYCYSANILKDKTKNIDDKSKNVMLDNIGYKKSMDTVLARDNKTVTQVTNSEDNELKPSCNIEFLDKNVYKIDDAVEEIDEKLPGPFDQCKEDLSHIGPYMTGTYNFAKFANDSRTIQQLVKLGVELYKIESDKEVLEMFLKLDFERDMKSYIQFLNDCGVNSENLGFFITRFPKIFKEDIDDLHTRIRYLRAHDFNITMIQIIVNKHPSWLAFKTEEIDRRLGYFQNNFKLNGSQIRNLAVKCPKLITYDMKRIRHSSFAIKEEMGFTKLEIHRILRKAPRVLIRARTEVVKTFDYLHNHMKLSHDIITQEPTILLCRKRRLEVRHRFLVELKKDQYDPTKPLYVSPLCLVTGSDNEFCEKVAKTSIHIYNDFLRTF